MVVALSDCKRATAEDGSRRVGSKRAKAGAVVPVLPTALFVAAPVGRYATRGASLHQQRRSEQDVDP